MIGVSRAETRVISDRFLLKINDRSIPQSDIVFQLRNLKALDCLYSDSLIVAYFTKKFITELEALLSSIPQDKADPGPELDKNQELVRKLRIFMKLLRYAEDQNQVLSPELTGLIREGSLANRCQTGVLFGDDLKTNFKLLIITERFLRSRYEGQYKGKVRNIDVIRPSLDLFMDSLDKQFNHEYFW